MVGLKAVYKVKKKRWEQTTTCESLHNCEYTLMTLKFTKK